MSIWSTYNAVVFTVVALLQASSWQQKYLTTQQALTAAQADAERSHKQAAAAAAVAQRHQQLLEQLSAAEAALADSHSSAQKLLLQLGESQASHRHTEQELRGEEAARDRNTRLWLVVLGQLVPIISVHIMCLHASLLSPMYQGMQMFYQPSVTFIKFLVGLGMLAIAKCTS